MSQPFIGEIQLYGFNFNPRDWAFCNGAVLPISQNTALFSLLGTMYGGNGQTTFALPNFAGRAGCQQGAGPGLSQRTMGQTFGAASVTLTSGQVPAHGHALNAYSQPDASKRSGTPVSNGGLSVAGSAAARPFNAGPADTTLAPGMVGATGSNQPHANQQPYLGVNFCIALQGIYPSFA